MPDISITIASVLLPPDAVGTTVASVDSGGAP